MAPLSDLLSHGEENGHQPESLKRRMRRKLPGLFSRKKVSPPGSINGDHTSEITKHLAYEENTRIAVPQPTKRCSSPSIPEQKQSQVPTGLDNKTPVAGAGPCKPESPSETMSGSAYHQAWQSLDENQRSDLKREELIRSLFEQLCKADQMHREKSFLRRGLSKSGPYLKKLSFVIDLASPLGSLDVTAGTAIGLVKGATSIAIAVCGAADELTGDIEKFLQSIPAIDRCDNVVKDGTWLPDIHHTLVNMYKALLHFHLKVMAIFQNSSFNVTMTIVMLKPETKDIIDSFNTYADTLDILLKSEVFASTQELKAGMVDSLIHDTLNTGRDKEEAYHNEFGDRADEACRWIESHDSFSSWISDSPDFNVLAMIGDMGCGKTMTSAYVVETLFRSHPVVCCYYCRQDHATTNLSSIYRSLLWQLLRQKPDLKFRFYQWQKMAPSQVDPTRSNVKLREFLFRTILSSPERIYIVLDGLDECKAMDRKALLGLFRDLLDKNAHLYVFLSSRYDDEIDPAFPGATTKIYMQASKARDRAIARYLVKETSVSKVFHEEVVDELAERANGSAIWLRIAIQYLQKLGITSLGGLGKALQRLPSSYSGLAKLYLDLFKKTCEEVWENEIRLQLALETLATARRPLRLHELAYAVFLRTEECNNIATISELDREATSVSLINFVRPFVSIVHPEAGDDPQLRLVHQSLKELIIWGPPEHWPSVGKNIRAQQQPRERLVDLNKRLLQCCIQYLLLEDCGEMMLVSNIQDGPEDGDFFTSMEPDIFEDGNEENETTSADVEPTREFNPSRLGLGHFFAYAASYWTSHFSDVLTELRPRPADLIALCRPGSQRLNNWVYQWCRPNCTKNPEYELSVREVDLDPLVVTAMFGPAASLADLLLSSHLQPPDFLKDSIWTALKELTKRGEVSSIKNFLEDTKIGPILHHPAFFYEVVPGWCEPSRLQVKNAVEWEAVFDFLIQILRESLLEAGNEILCLAARNGCLILIKRLFEAGKVDPDLKAAILAVNRKRKRAGKGPGGLDFHQSIGEAVWEGHAEVVQFLCQQHGTEHHLRYINHAGRTVFHQWARYPDAQVLRILIQHWPEGVHLKNAVNDTPLVEFIFNSNRDEDEIIEHLQIFISMGNANASGKDDEAWHTPLRTAARQAKAKVCRFLITNGSADIYSVLRVDQVTWKPFLIDQVSSAGDQKAWDEVKMLKELCSLLPLAVSTEYLS